MPANKPKLLGNYLTQRELAEGLNKCVETIYRWHRLGIGPPFVKVGRDRLSRPEDVDAWMRAGGTNSKKAQSG
jgi:excisionase family DNA binding protein